MSGSHLTMKPLLLSFLLAAAAFSQPDSGDRITAVLSSTAFPASGAGAPIEFQVGDSFTLSRLSDEGGRYLAYFSESGTAPYHRTDAAAFGIAQPDPWAVEPGATGATRYAHGRVNVRSGAGTSNSRIGQLERDDFVQVQVCHDGWCRVSGAGDGWSDGYVSEPLLHEDPSPAARAAFARSGRSYSSGSRVPSTDSRTCASFSSESAAQAAYDADPIGLRRLDRDGDGDACESTWRARPAPRARRAATTRTCYTGPRGGRYYINSNGNRTYGC
ncbi:hypothetical protein B1759_15070 [Rubrivirga sp. SAORIC476]|uniref:SH3 domain-containing protein n=1 Tax=Rubrivirga sp. SAORIC476 TaxID=1961794 RepID=UPI000BA9AE26|nr:hypothetical protein B1759_15070 [Rubrivirga sp. SAORIC476]